MKLKKHHRRKLTGIPEILAALTRAKLEGGLFAENERARNFRIAIALILSALVFGGLLWFKTRAEDGLLHQHLNQYFARKGLFGFFQKNSADKTTPGTRVLSDFENTESLSVWELDHARFEFSEEYVYGGKKSAKVMMEKVPGGGTTSGIAIEDAFTTRRGFGDWSSYAWFRFHIFNPNDTPERIILQIKDRWKRIFKQDINLNPHDGQIVLISIPALSKEVNIKKIEQLLLFRWEPKDDKNFYVDDFRLLETGLESAVFQTLEDKTKERPVNPVTYGFEFKKSAWQLPQKPPHGEVIRIPFVVTNHTYAPCVECQVEGGIPLPMGEVQSTENLRLVRADGAEMGFQPRVLSKWPDGSLAWVAPAFETSLAPAQSLGFYLDYGPELKAKPYSSTLQVLESPEGVQVNTGKLKALFSRKQFFLFEQVFLDENQNGNYETSEKMVSQAPLTLEFKGREFRTDLASKDYTLEVEEIGPVRAVVKASGWFQAENGQRFCRTVMRYTFYQGKSFVKTAHTLIYTGYPANLYFEPYQKLKLPENEMISGFGLRVPFQFTDPNRIKIQIGKTPPQIFEFPFRHSFRIMQMGYEHARLENGGQADPGTDYWGGWLDASDSSRGIMTAVRHFRENFPKAMSVEKNGEIRLDLWPSEAGPIDLSTTKDAIGPEDMARGSAFGLGKTHEILFYFHSGDSLTAQAPQRGDSFMERLVLQANPYWVQATGALGHLFPADPKYKREEGMLDQLFDWADRQPKMSRWYGMLNFGDTLTWHRSEDETQWYPQAGWNPVGRWGWYNCEGVGTHTGALLQFVRTGRWEYFQFGENLARHIMDVDTVHDNTIQNDPRLKKLDPAASQPGSMHRHSANHWSGRSDEASHTSVVGLVYYYYLTGDERALDVIREVGEFFLKGSFGYSNDPDRAPHRGMANALWGDVLLYQITKDERYKKQADQIISIYLSGQQADGSFLEDYNPKLQTWSGEKHYLYMEGYALGAFIAYHQLTQDEDVKQMILKMVNFLKQAEFSTPSILNGIAYAYWMTGDMTYLGDGEKALKFLHSHQQASRDPILDGLIYEKPIYHRPMVFLSTVPYIFAALEDGFQKYEAGQA